MSDERNIPCDIFVLQDLKEFSNAVAKRWGNDKRWRPIDTVADLVSEVKEVCGTKGFIRLLTIGGHGTKTSFRLGRKIVTTQSVEDIEVWLRDLHPFVKPGKSVVHLDHCNVGHDELLLKRFAVLTGGTIVVGPLSDQYTNEGAPAFEGDKVNVCTGKACITSYFPNDSVKNHISLVTHWEVLSGASVSSPQGPVEGP